ncbi:hypothetical protein ACHQM5_022962 [Ranunculus cassubicifolius]
MDSDDDYHQSSAPTEPSSPINHRRLKRLKKAIRVPISQTLDPISSTKIVDPEDSETLLAENPVDLMANSLELKSFNGGRDLENEFGDLRVNRNQLENRFTDDSEMTDPNIIDSPINVERDLAEKLEGLNDGRDVDNELDDLFVYRDRSEDRSSFDDDREDLIEVPSLIEKTNGEEGEKLGEEKKVVKKKRSSKDRMDEERSKKSKKRGKSVDEKGNSEPPARTKRKLEKERKAHLEQLHAESQRLLRETRDAEFKPVPLVQKPISSILEKIRQRKLEVSKKASMLKNHFQTDDSPREVEIDLYPEQVADGNFSDKNPAEVARDVHLVNEESNDVEVTHIKRSSETTSRPIESETLLSNTALDEDSKTTFRAPIDDTQDLFDDTEQSDEEDMEDSQQDSPVDDEEVLAPSVLTMNLKLDSAPLDDDSSDEENYDKENVDPHPHKRTDELIGDPVKAFVDDEAEEEDDSDDDLLRFKENEEDDENEESEEFNDLIATGYEERPSDNIKRDQLHQMWLEQQDAAATDNVLQRLKCGGGKQKLKDLSALEEDDDNDDDEDLDGDSMDESGDELHPNASLARQNSRKMKQMIPQMYTDNDDVFLSDDEEETKQKLVRMRLLHKAEEHTSLLPPAEDENSREVFGLIKKLNIAPEPKKKATSSCFFDSLITVGNSNSSSRSSFLGRAQISSVPSANKAGSSNFRSFIFGRDDSNSRSAITSEVSDTGENSNRATKTGTAKFISSSQSQINSQNKTETTSSSSLFEILKKSAQSDHIVRNNTISESETQIAVQFAAFKSVKRVLKVDARN